MGDSEETEKIKNTFKAYDANGDGLISRDEMANVLRTIGDWTDEDLDELFAAADTNSDGSLEYDEFLNWVLGGEADDVAEVKNLVAGKVAEIQYAEAQAETAAAAAEVEAAEAENEEEQTSDEPEPQGEADQEETSKEVEEVKFDLKMRLPKKTCVAVLVGMDHDKATADSIMSDFGKIIPLEDFLEVLDVNPESRSDMKDIMAAIDGAGGGLPAEAAAQEEAPAEPAEPEAEEEEAAEPTPPGPQVLLAAADALVRHLDREGFESSGIAPDLLKHHSCPLSTLEKTALQNLSDEDLVAKIDEFKTSPPLLPASEGRLSARLRCKARVKAIIEECKAEGKKWSDPDFDVQKSPNAVLWVDKEKPGYDNTVNPPGGWKRISELCEEPCLVADGGKANDIIQGSAGTCFLLGAMGAIVGNDKHALKKIFITHDFDVGIFGIQFCVEGEWMYLLVDDWMPVMDDCLMYCSSKDDTEWWAPLLEKAYCKLMSCYEMCDGGQSAEAVFSFCGGVNGFFSIEDKHKEDPASYFKLLKGARQRGYMLTCGFVGSKKATGGKGPCGEPLLPCGLVSGHAYSVLKVVEAEGNQLVCIRNPWGSGEWTGKWGDNNKEGEWTDEMKEATGHKVGEDGTFWMTVADFCANARCAEFARPFGPLWKKVTQYGRFQEGAITATVIKDHKTTAEDEISLTKGAEVECSRCAGFWAQVKTESGDRFFPLSNLKLNARPVATFALSGDQTDDKAVVMLMQPNSYMKRKFYKRKEDGLNYKDTKYPSLTLIVVDGDKKVLLKKSGPYRCVWGEIALQGLDKSLTVYAMSAGGTADRFSIRTYIKGGVAKIKEIPNVDASDISSFL